MQNAVRQRSLLQRLFISPDEPRLRAGWRLLLHTLLFFGLALVLVLPLVALQFAGMLDLLGTAGTAAQMATQAVAIVLATIIARRVFDRRSVTSLGLQPTPNALPDVLAGIVIAGVVMGVIFLAEWTLGWLSFEGFAWHAQPANEVLLGLLGYGSLFVLVGFYEELMSRGYHLQNLAEGLNLPLGLFLSSAIFGVLHLGNPEATWASALGILLAGYFLAYGWLRTRQLWIPIGLHIGWNFFEGPVFGFPVSGLNTIRLIRHTVSGPALVTGGAFGPEAGLIVIPAMALGAALVWWWTRGRRLEVRG